MSRFDKAAEAWVRKHIEDPGEIAEGSVTFDIDAAAYASSAWCHFDVNWTEILRYRTHNGTELPPGSVQRHYHIEPSAWSYDATDLMRELTEWEEDGDVKDQG